MNDFSDQFLIAMPAMGDERFAQSVAYVCEHNDDGAMGIVINRPLGVNLGDVFEHMSIETDDEALKETIVFAGGPVETQRGFVLHPPGGDWDSGIEVDGKLQITTSKDILEAIANGDGPEKYLIALGYAGWEAGQLEEELVENTWLSVESASAILFDTPVDKRWQSAADLIGVDLKRMSSNSGHA